MNILKISFFITMFLLVVYSALNYRFGAVECVGVDGDCSSFVKDKLSSISDVRLLEVSKKIKLALSGVNEVKDYRLHYFFDRIRVEVVEREVLYSVSFGNESGIVSHFSSDGVLIKKEEGLLPDQLFIEGPGMNVGEKVTGKLANVMEIDNRIREYVFVKKSTYANQKLELELESGQKYIFPDDKEVDYLTGAFVLIYNQLNNNADEFRINDSIAHFSSVDLRFTNPVLKF